MGTSSEVSGGTPRERMGGTMRILRYFLLLVVVLACLALPAVGFAADKGMQCNPIADPYNDRIAVQVAGNGRFNMGAFPDPATGSSQAGSWDLMYRWPSGPGTSFTTIRVDGADYAFGDGAVSQTPTDIDADTNECEFRYGDILVTQRLRLVVNPLTGEKDVCEIAYTATNTGSVVHSVGTRVMIDTELNYNDGAPFRIPGVGAVTQEAEYLGSSIPARADVFYSLTDASHSAAVQLRSSDPQPDRFVIAAWPGIVGTLWDYSVSEGRSITSDSAYAVYWNPISLEPGSSTTFTTRYGLGDVSADLRPPLGLGVSGPTELSAAGNSYAPNPFDVIATVVNNSGVSVEGVIATLNLDSGLSASDTNMSRNLGVLAPGEERQVAWSVTAGASTVERNLSYGVTVVGNDADPKTITRTIVLPALVNQLDRLKPGDIILESHSQVGWWNDQRDTIGAYYTHAMIYTGVRNGQHMVVEAYGPGRRSGMTPLEGRLFGTYQILRPKGASDLDRETVARIAERVFVDVPYGWDGPLPTRAGLSKSRLDRLYCSSLVWNAWKRGAKIDLDSDYVGSAGKLASLYFMPASYYVMPDDLAFSDKVEWIIDIPLN